MFPIFSLDSVSPLLQRLLTLDLTTLAAAEMTRSSSETSLASSTAGSSTAVSTAGDWANEDTEQLIKSESSTPCHHNTRSVSLNLISWAVLTVVMMVSCQSENSKSSQTNHGSVCQLEKAKDVQMIV